jgi:hypothetical protein
VSFDLGIRVIKPFEKLLYLVDSVLEGYQGVIKAKVRKKDVFFLDG